MTWGEAVRLTRLLRMDPGSQVAAAMEGWEHPFPRIEAQLADLFDVAAPHTYKKPKPYPRPYRTQSTRERERHGSIAVGASQSDVKARLAAARAGDVPWAPV